MTDDRARQAHKAAEHPELRIISRAGKELTADALNLANYQHLSCNDYVVEVSSDDQQSLDADKGRCYMVMSLNDLSFFGIYFIQMQVCTTTTTTTTITTTVLVAECQWVSIGSRLCKLMYKIHLLM